MVFVFLKEKKIFVVGPPGINIKEITLKLSQHFNSTTISIGDLLKKEVMKKTELGAKIEEYLQEKIYVPDIMVVEILKKYLKTLDPQKHVFIEGFPKTIYQAKYMINEKLIPDSLIFINNSNKNSINDLIKKFIDEGSSEEDANRDAKNYMDLFKFNYLQTKNSFKDLALEIDYSDLNKMELLAKMINIKLNNGCQYPLKILINGKKSEKSLEFRQKLSTNFGLKIIDIDSLLASHLKSNSEIGKRIVNIVENEKQLGNDFLLEIVLERILKVDCRINGFILDVSDKKLNFDKFYENPLTKFQITLFLDDRESFNLCQTPQNNLILNKNFLVDTKEDLENQISRIFFDITHYYETEMNNNESLK